MEKLTFWQYCKANPMWFVAMAFFIGMASVSFYLGEASGIGAGIFFSIVGSVLVLGQIRSYQKL